MFSKYENPVVIPTDFIMEDTAQAINRADIIMINTPAFAQDVYEELIGKYGKKGQIVVFPCGGFSAVNFDNYLKNIGAPKRFLCLRNRLIYLHDETYGSRKRVNKGYEEESYVCVCKFPKHRLCIRDNE